MKLSKSKWALPMIVGCGMVLLAAIVYFWLVMVNVYTVDVTLRGSSEITLEYGESFEDPGATAAFCGTIFQREPLNVPVTVEGSVDVTKVGEYTLCYKAEYEETYGMAERKVCVVDSVTPEIVLEGDDSITLPVGTEYLEPGYSASDNYSGDLSAAVSVSGAMDPSVPGSYTLTYSVSDSSGNKAQATRVVTYIDVTAPVITLTGDTVMELDNGAVYEEPGFVATDDCHGNC